MHLDPRTLWLTANQLIQWLLTSFFLYILLQVFLGILDGIRAHLQDRRDAACIFSAEMPRAGSWQYTDAYFDTIEEFRNDFTGA